MDDNEKLRSPLDDLGQANKDPNLDEQCHVHYFPLGVANAGLGYRFQGL